jgi:nicotinate (nicotinamide) nucleotide adenylyltransferase
MLTAGDKLAVILFLFYTFIMLPIAIGGSAANPATIGHYRLIEWLLNSGKFSTVIWILSGDRPDKNNLIDSDHRLALTLLTFPQEWFLRTDVRFVISFEDVYGKNTPTIDWLEKTQKIYFDNKLIWYTGADSVIPKPEYNNLSEIETKWVRGSELIKNWNFLVFPRHGYTDIKTLSLPSNFEIADAELPEVSSSEVRRRIISGEPFEDLMMPNAVKYIKQNKLYGYDS